MFTPLNIMIAVIAVLVIATVIGLISRYRKCASDEILVVYGRAGKRKVKNSETGKTETQQVSAKIIHGGGTFVLPVIQNYKTMSLKPIQFQCEIKGRSSEKIIVTIPVTLSTAIGLTDELRQNAANRFLSSTAEEVKDFIRDIFIGEVRSIMSTMTVEEINADRSKFIDLAKDTIEPVLNNVGYTILNITTADVDDDANFLGNLAKKAATKAKAQAEADIAEEQKKGDVQIAETTREREIAIAEAEKERTIKVAQTKQQQETQAAAIRQEQESKIAEIEKQRVTNIANQNAEREANEAKAQAQAEVAKAQALAEQEANIAKSKSEADAAKAQRQAEADASMAKSKADADAQKAEAEATKAVRMEIAKQQQIAETERATNEQETKVAEYQSIRRQKSAEADRAAGVAEQEATIAVAEARGRAAEAEAAAVQKENTAKVNAEMEVAKMREKRQAEVNELAAKAKEAEYNATTIITAKKEKERVTIEAEAIKEKAKGEAEAAALRIIKEAEAKAQEIDLVATATADGERKKLLAEADGKRALLMAEADQFTKMQMAPAEALERMIAAGLTPELCVQYKTVDHLADIARANAEVYEHIHLGEVTVYGNENTAGNFMSSMAENLNPAFKLLNSIPISDSIRQLIKGSAAGASAALVNKAVGNKEEETSIQPLND